MSDFHMIDFTISTDLLQSVLEFASDDRERPHIQQVLFDDRAMVATNGHILVRVPHADIPGAGDGDGLSVHAKHLHAAVMAARALESRSINFVSRPPRNEVLLGVGSAASLLVPVGDIKAYPPYKLVIDAHADPARADGMMDATINPRYLEQIVRVTAAQGGGAIMIRSWTGNLRDPIKMENQHGATFVIMCMAPRSSSCA